MRSIATRRTLRGLHALGNLVAVAVMLASIAFLAPSLLGMQRYVITGGSMSGTFERGSVAFEKIVPVAQLRVGDIITYQPPADSGLTNLVTHRIVKIRSTDQGVVYRTKGDANASADPWNFHLRAATQPRMVYNVPYVGYAFLALSERSARILVIGIPAGLIALFSLVELLRALRKPQPPGTEAPAPVGVPVAGPVAGAGPAGSLKPLSV